MNSVLPTKPSAEPERPRGSWGSIVFMSLFGLAMLSGMCLVTAGIMPQVLILGGAIMLFVGLNYVVWGWWLPKILPKEEADKGKSTEQ